MATENVRTGTNAGTHRLSIALAALVLAVSAPLPAPRAAAVQDGVPAWVADAPRSHAMGLWTPRHAVINGMSACTPAFHDTFFVIGPDGARYPTWHPPVAVDPATGTECAFGHEHGRDPRGSQLWRTRQLQRAWGYDANGNGRIDPDEEAWAGVPFGYVNAQADTWFDHAGLHTMRHEDHVGHKIDYANGEPDIATHGMSTVADGGVWIGQLGEGVMARDTGMRCAFFAKAHQGTSTPDAFRNNLHEVLYAYDCRHKDDLATCASLDDWSTCRDSNRQNARVTMAVLQPFGREAGFTELAPLCGRERRSDARDRVEVGHSQFSADYPDGAGDREIVTRDCVERGFLVEEGTFSGNPYEAWPATLAIRTAGGREIVSAIGTLFDVNDAARYYYPEALKASRGYAAQHPELAGTDLGYMQDLCYERFGSRRAHHGMCDASTHYGADEGIAWDDPRAAFRGLNRGMYFHPGLLRNAAGPAVWYTDPFGGRAATTPFPGAVRQDVSRREVDYGSLIAGRPIDPRIVQRVHADGRGTVHAPN